MFPWGPLVAQGRMPFCARAPDPSFSWTSGLATCADSMGIPWLRGHAFPGRPCQLVHPLKACVLFCEVGTVPSRVSIVWGSAPVWVSSCQLLCSGFVEGCPVHPFWEGGHGKVGCDILMDAPPPPLFSRPEASVVFPGSAFMRDVMRPLGPCVVLAVLCGYPRSSRLAVS